MFLLRASASHSASVSKRRFLEDAIFKTDIAMSTELTISETKSIKSGFENVGS